MNLGAGEVPKDKERKQEVQDGREVKSHKAKQIGINGFNCKSWWDKSKL